MNTETTDGQLVVNTETTDGQLVVNTDHRRSVSYEYRQQTVS